MIIINKSITWYLVWYNSKVQLYIVQIIRNLRNIENMVSYVRNCVDGLCCQTLNADQLQVYKGQHGYPSIMYTYIASSNIMWSDFYKSSIFYTHFSVSALNRANTLCDSMLQLKSEYNKWQFIKVTSHCYVYIMLG